MAGKINKAGRKPEGDLPLASSLGSRIRRARIARGWSTQTLAEHAETTDSTITRIELGRSNPEDRRTRRTITLIAKALGKHFGEAWLKPYVNGGNNLTPAAQELLDLFAALSTDRQRALIKVAEEFARREPGQPDSGNSKDERTA